MSRNLEVVRTMLHAWERRDVDAILATMAPDARYHNIPMPELRGAAAIRTWIEGFLKSVASFEVETYVEGEGENLVFNERADIIGYADGRSASIPIAGVFRLQDGLIVDWRDYFDLAQFQSQLR